MTVERPHATLFNMSPRSGSSNSRGVERVEVRIAAKIQIAQKNSTQTPRRSEGEIWNLSEKGAYIRTDAPCQVGEQVMLEIQFTGPVVLAGKATTWEALRGLAVHSASTAKESKSAGTSELPKRFSSDTIVRWTSAEPKSPEGFGVEFTALDPSGLGLLRKILHYYEILRRAGVSFD